MLPAFDKQGHRGCRGLMPENTIPAFMHALSLGVTTLEMDAVITQDKQVILSHEPFFNHDITTKADGSFFTAAEEKQFNIFQMSYATANTFDVGLKPNPRFLQQKKIAAHKPLLSAVIDSVKQYVQDHKIAFPYFNIETKSQPSTDNVFHPAPAEFVDLLMNVIKEKNIEAHVIIQSFDFRTLQYLHQKYPGIKTAMLIEGNDSRTLDQQLDALGFTPDIYSPAYALVKEELIRACHDKKMRIIPWTVNDKPTIEKLKGMGVDGIISDYPNLF